MTNSIYQFTAKTLNEEEKNFNDYQGKVLLIVNTASKCGLTSQYEGLEKLYQDYKEQGLEVIGFPCGQFANQELDSGAEISEFCQLNYGVSFQIMAKIEVNGDNAHPIYQWLKMQKGGLLTDNIKWNFTKFLINKDGQVVKRYAPTTKPSSIATDIEKLL